MTEPTTILQTERLRLRPLVLDDLDALYQLYRDAEIRRYFPEGTLTYEETREELEWIINVYYAQYGFGLWATIHKPTGEFIGRCGLLPWTIEGRAEVEVAYLLSKAYWRQGLGTEAARGIAAYAFEQLGLPRLICLVDPGNVASQRVAQNIGMMLEQDTLLDGERTFIYSMSKPVSGNL
ncbi:MAG: GNAT family N-acetyltransferase [Anaerolineae bacterium]|nr:GNAT family N-acetyltransferase [Anaerolineae bacterium]